MIDTIYPTNPKEWAAMITALLPVFALAGSALWRGWIYSGERHEKEWERLYRITRVLGNLGNNQSFATWEQITAVRELETLRINRSAAVLIAKDAYELWSNQTEPTKLVSELNRVIKRNSGCIVERIYWRIRLR